MKKAIASLIMTAMLAGCVSPNYCKGLDEDPEHSDLKCALAVTADVVLVAGTVVLVAAAAGGGGGSSNYSPVPNEADEPLCMCPSDKARDGSRCGERSAWNIEGGQKPYCVGLGQGK